MRVAARVDGSDFAPNTKDYGRALSDIGRCDRCGHMQLIQMPSDVILGEVYGDAADVEYVDEEEGQRATAREILGRLEEHVPPGRLLDLGCWVGFLMSEATKRGWTPTGVEPSGWASAYAREQLGLTVLNDDLMTAPLPEGGFDAVVLGDVIEHLPEPSEGLQRIATLLAPGGALVLMLPDAGSRLARMMGKRWWSVLPTHVQYFTRESMTTLLEREGWKVVELRTAPKIFTVGYYLSRLGGYSKAIEKVLLGSAKAVRVADRAWGPDFRDRMLVIAVRA
ncbi:MAG: putative Methyltransferase type 12 [Frankiales bacterium]|nr:putative Methyltransferase type 12 [Frankiales bacterium]